MKEYQIKGNENITIGRDKTNDICIDDKEVSSHHALIKKEGNVTSIIDNSSTNGTIVNRQKVSIQALNDNDVITIGPVDFKYMNGTLTFFRDDVIFAGQNNNQQIDDTIAPSPFLDMTGSFYTIGRADDCTITLDEVVASRHHAIIKKQDRNYIIIDNSSTHGTYINGTKIASHTLNNNDAIKIGSNTFYYSNGQLYNDFPSGQPMHTSIISKPVTKIKKSGGLLSNKKLRISTIIASAMVVVLVATILISSFTKTSRLAEFDQIDVSEYPSIGQLAVSSPYYYVNVDTPTDKNKKFPKYMSILIKDSFKAADLLMDNFYLTQYNVEKLYPLVLETAKLCDAQYKTNYTSETALIKEINDYAIRSDASARTYARFNIKNYGSDMAFADVVSIKTVSAVQAGNLAIDEYLLLSTMSATLYQNHMIGSTGQIKTNLEEIEEITSKNYVYGYIGYIASCIESIENLLIFIEIAKTEVALENLKYIENDMPYVKKDLQTIAQNGSLSKKEYADAVSSVSQLSAFVDVYKPFLEEKLNYYEITNAYTYYAYPENPLLITAHAANGSNFGNSIDVKTAASSASAKAESGGFWSTVSGVAGATWSGIKSTAKAARSCVGVPLQALGDISYMASRAALGKYYGNDSTDIAADIDARIKGSIKKLENPNTIGADEFKQIIDGNSAFQDTVKEGWQNIGSLIDIIINDNLESITGGTYDSSFIEGTLGILGNAAAGTFTGLSNGTARIADPKSSYSDMAKGIYEIASAVTSFSPKAAGATDMNLLDAVGSDDIGQIVGDLLISELKDIRTKGGKAMIDMADSAINGQKPTEAPTPVADNPNDVVGDYSLFCENSTVKVGQLVNLSVNKVDGALYNWHVDDAKDSVVNTDTLNSFAPIYFTPGYHYPKVLIFDSAEKLLGSATTTILVEGYDFNLSCNNNSPGVAEEITFTLSSNDVNFNDVEVGWDLGDDNLILDADIFNHSYATAGRYPVSIEVFKDIENIGEIVLGKATCYVDVQPLNEFRLTASKTRVKIGENITFEVNPWLERVRYEWVIAGTAFEGASVNINYTNAGTDTVEVQVSDENGILFEDSIFITIEEDKNTPTAPQEPSPQQPAPVPDSPDSEFPNIVGTFVYTTQEGGKEKKKYRVFGSDGSFYTYTQLAGEVIYEYSDTYQMIKASSTNDYLFSYILDNKAADASTIYESDISGGTVISLREGVYVRN